MASRRRLQLARDDWISAATPEGEGEARRNRLVLETPIERAWRVRIPGEYHRADHPGTPLLFRDRFFEVVSFEPGRPHRYTLASWDERFSMRGPEELSPAAVEAAYAAHADAERRARLRPWIALSAPLLGALAQNWQLALEDRAPYDAPRATGISGFLGMCLGIALAVYGALRFSETGRPSPWLAIGPFLFAESALRWLSGWHLQSAMGSFPIVFLCRALERLQPARVGAALRSTGPKRLPEDVVTLDQGDGQRTLWIEADHEKPDWILHRTALDYDDEAWVPVSHQRAGDDGVHRYALEPLGEDDMVLQRLTYDPREAALRRLATRLAKDRTFVQSLTPCFGLLDADRKGELERLHGFDGVRATRTSALFVALFAGFLAYLGFGNVRDGGGVSDAAMTVLGLLGLLDSARRWASLSRQPASWFGRVVDPLADPVLERARRARRTALRLWGEHGPARLGQEPSQAAQPPREAPAS